MPQVSNYSLQMDNPSLVDYGYGAPSPRVKYRNSDIDFRDVFGGPPRRASVHDVRYSFTEGMDSVEVLGRRIGEASVRDPWKAGEEKPVFGEAESVSRRRYLREDFFDDIFKGGESPSSTPRNVFSMSPGPRVLSPARPLPARVDGSGSPPSLPLGSQESFESSEKLDDSKKDSEEHQFHFSTYNWANQGVSIPVVMPFNRTNSKNPKEFKGRQIFQDVDAAAAHDDVSRTDRGGEISEIKVMDVNQDLIEEEHQEKEDVKKVPLQESQKPGGQDRTPKRRGKSKVKDFIRIFNQETPSKPRTPNSHPSQGSVRKEEEEEPTLTVEAATQQEKRRRNAIDDEKRNISKSVEVPKKEPDASDKIGSTSRRSQKEDSKSTTSTAKPPPSSHSSSRNGFPENFPENARAEEADDFSQANFTMKELSEEEQQQGEATGESDEIQATDAKIHEWALGKEGNIRSLLTTLQFVLWPGSGWKPVALMNIIEGPGVKRAYQKAMLCLHPDKLQQKGASFHEKYVAEKALYILQEAWDHFNTLGGL